MKNSLNIKKSTIIFIIVLALFTFVPMAFGNDPVPNCYPCDGSYVEPTYNGPSISTIAEAVWTIFMAVIFP